MVSTDLSHQASSRSTNSSRRGKVTAPVVAPSGAARVGGPRTPRRGVSRITSEDTFGGFDDSMAWADAALGGDFSDGEQELATALAGPRATAAGARVPTRQVSQASRDWFAVGGQGNAAAASRSSDVGGRRNSGDNGSNSNNPNQPRGTGTFRLAPPKFDTPPFSSPLSSSLHSAKSAGHLGIDSERHKTQCGADGDARRALIGRRIRAKSDTSPLQIGGPRGRRQLSLTPQLPPDGAVPPTSEEIRRAEEILRLARRQKEAEEDPLRTSSHSKDGSRRGRRSESRHRQSEAEDGAEHSASLRHNRRNGSRGDGGEVNGVESESSRWSRHSRKSSIHKEDLAESNRALGHPRQPNDETNGVKKEKNRKKAKKLEDLMSIRDHFGPETDEGTIVSKTRQSARRGRAARRRSATGAHGEGAPSGPSDHSVGPSRRASIAVGGVEELRARSLSRTRRRGSVSNTAHQTPERSMLGDHPDLERTDDEELNFEDLRRAKILDQSRKGPIASSKLRQLSAGQLDRQPGGASSQDDFAYESGNHSNSDLGLSSQKSRRSIYVSSNDWERGLEDVLGRRNAARENTLLTATDQPSQSSPMMADAKVYAEGRRNSNSGANTSGPKMDLTKLTPSIASPAKAKNRDPRTPNGSRKGKDRKSTV